MAAVLFVAFAGELAGHEGDGGDVHVQGVDVVLGEETDAEAGVLGYETFCRGQGTDEEFEDRRLARAIGADDADAGVELDVEVDVGEERGFSLVVAELHAGHLDDGRGEFLNVGEAEVDCVFGFGGFEDGHLFEFLDAGLGFGGFGGVVAELVDEGLEEGALGLLVFVLAEGSLAAFFFCGVECVWEGVSR